MDAVDALLAAVGGSLEANNGLDGPDTIGKRGDCSLANVQPRRSSSVR